MTIFLSLIFIVGGFVLLIKGADWLVDGSTAIARKLNISDLVIGLTIVSFGTSAPELIVNVIASLQGSSDIAVSNIIGSNLSNLLLILGTTAIIYPLRVKKSTVFKEIPFCLLAAILLFIVANDALVDGYGISEISRSDGFVLLGFFVVFMYYVFGISKDNSREHVTHKSLNWWFAALLIIGGMIGLGTGGELVVRGAKEIASNFGLSESLIGLTIVAIGTSLPELVASVVAALKKSPDIAVGNIIGSNIFNIFWIVGLSAAINPLAYDTTLNPDALLVVVATALLFLFINTGKTTNNKFFWRKKHHDNILSRTEGIVLLGLYVAYIIYIIYRG